MFVIIRILFSCLLLTFLSSCKSQVNLNKTPIGLINNVSYKDAQFNNSNASNGFLVNYEKQTYAITAKHVLMIAKTHKMQFPYFSDELDKWEMHTKENSTNTILLDKLLSSNQTDSLTWSFMDANWESYNDWL